MFRQQPELEQLSGAPALRRIIAAHLEERFVSMALA